MVGFLFGGAVYAMSAEIGRVTSVRDLYDLSRKTIKECVVFEGRRKQSGSG